MKISKLIFCMGTMFAVSMGGCVSEAPEKTSSISDIIDTDRFPTEILKEAVQCERDEKYMDAVRRYNAVIDRTYVLEELQKATLGRARSLMLAGELDAALVSLDPLNEDPTTLFDCRKLAMAARILDAKNTPIDAESAIEIAIGKCPRVRDTEIFRAEALAFLGRIYIKNNKPNQALRVFEIAEQLYINNQLKTQAETCRSIISYIKEK